MTEGRFSRSRNAVRVQEHGEPTTLLVSQGWGVVDESPYVLLGAHCLELLTGFGGRVTATGGARDRGAELSLCWVEWHLCSQTCGITPCY